MRHVSLAVLLVFCFSVFPGAADAQVQHPEHAFIVGWDKAGMNVRAEDNYKVMLEGLKFFRSLKRFREYSGSHLVFLDMTTGKPVWMGTPRTLTGAEQKKALETIIIKENMCVDLERGFASLQTQIRNIERQGFKHLHIFIFSPLIHTGIPCPEPDITLPQIPPVNFDFSEALMSSRKIKSVLFFNVNPGQMEVWGVDGIMKPLTAWDDQGPEFTFQFYDEAASLMNLKTEVRRMFGR